MPLAMGHAQAAVSAHNDHNADSHHSKDRHEAAMRKRRSADRCEEGKTHEIEKTSALMVRSRKMETPSRRASITIFCSYIGKLRSNQAI